MSDPAPICESHPTPAWSSANHGETNLPSRTKRHRRSVFTVVIFNMGSYSESALLGGL